MAGYPLWERDKGKKKGRVVEVEVGGNITQKKILEDKPPSKKKGGASEKEARIGKKGVFPERKKLTLLSSALEVPAGTGTCPGHFPSSKKGRFQKGGAKS